MTWTLVREVGIEYGDGSEAIAAGMPHCAPLRFPTYAARADDGTYVIAEEAGIHKQVPFRFECRTLRIDESGEVLFDSKRLGLDDGFGCLTGDNSLAIVRRAHWEIVLVAPDGLVSRRIPLHRFSKRIPRYARWTPANTLLVVFFNRSFEIDVVEIDLEGRLLWFLPSDACRVGIPASVQRLDDQRLLISDSFRHWILVVDRLGRLMWQFGQPDDPSNRPRRLSSPNAVTELPDGRHLIADTRNHQVLALDVDGTKHPWPLRDGCLCDPYFVDSLPDGGCLVCDTGNGRVIHVDPDGHVKWSYGDRFIQRRHLSYPRSVDVLEGDRYLIADTGNDRILEIRDQQVSAQPVSVKHELFWPRCVRQNAEGTYLIADARNGRVMEMQPDGQILHELHEVRSDGITAFKDPHDVRWLPNGHLLVCDSPQNLVVEVDWSGRVYRMIGDREELPLKDPHSAQGLGDGSVLISDTGHHRLLIVDAEGHCRRSIQAVVDRTELCRLHFPRYAEIGPGGTIVVADTGQNRILGCSTSGEYRWQFTDVPASPISTLNQPRWATVVGTDELVVCDHFHHRMVHVRRSSSL